MCLWIPYFPVQIFNSNFSFICKIDSNNNNQWDMGVGTNDNAPYN